MPPVRHTSPSSPHIKVRQRSRRACAPCRKRKIKCDGDEPCAACVGYGYQCEYTERQSSPKASPHKPSDNAVSVSNPVTAQATPLSAPWAIPQNEVGPYLASESIVQDALLHQSIKTRFASSSSAVAFPANLGSSLGLSQPPRLQAFGWNPGIRPEYRFLPSKSICDLVSFDDMRRFMDKYFEVVHVHFGMLPKELVIRRAEEFWTSDVKRGLDYEASCSHLLAIGSYFSGVDKSPIEAEIVDHGRVLLDLSVAHPPALLSTIHVNGWILRTLYLRLTTRPHLSWMASCTAVHIAEAIGLHREIKDTRLSQDSPRNITPQEEELRRRSFWVATSLNKFLSAEYGRTKAHIDLINCKPLSPEPDPDLTHETVCLLQSACTRKSLDSTFPELFATWDKNMALPVKSPLHGLLRADASFCLYRMFRSTNAALSSDQIYSLLQVIQVALDGTKFLSSISQPWWNIVSTSFHCVCVLLSLNTTESLAMIPSAMETLINVVSVYDTHVSKEALRTAQALVEGARAKMARDMESLDRGLSFMTELSPPKDPGAIGSNAFGPGLIDDLNFRDYFDFQDIAGFDGFDSFNSMNTGLHAGWQ